MRLLQTDILGHYQVEVNITLVSRAAGAQFMEANYLAALLS
jgi:hypothetical protein